MATTSSGLTSLEGSLPNSLLTNSWIYGILVEPPTNKTVSMSLADNLASLRAFLTASNVESNKSLFKSSNLARFNVTFKCNGPSAL